MKSILLSIKPKYAELIASGKKTIEVRKSAPKEVPFKAYIYETYDKKYDDIGICWGKGKRFEHGCKNVIGEFICDKVYNLVNAFGGLMFADENLNQLDPQLFRDMSCLTDEQTADYLGDKDGYGWHISDLKIYDKPKELSEFLACNGNCNHCKHRVVNQNDVGDVRCENEVTRPPQSYMFVEEITK